MTQKGSPSALNTSSRLILQLLILFIVSNIKLLVSTCNLIPVVSRLTFNRQQSTKKMLTTSLHFTAKRQDTEVRRLAFFVLIVGPCYFIGLAIRNTIKILKQTHFYGDYLKAKEKLWKHISYSLCRICGGGLPKKKRSRSSSQAFWALGLTSKWHLFFYLLVKCRIKTSDINHQG